MFLRFYVILIRSIISCVYVGAIKRGVIVFLKYILIFSCSFIYVNGWPGSTDFLSVYICLLPQQSSPLSGRGSLSDLCMQGECIMGKRPLVYGLWLKVSKQSPLHIIKLGRLYCEILVSMLREVDIFRQISLFFII